MASRDRRSATEYCDVWASINYTIGMSELPRQTVFQLVDRAEQHYSNEMPYHNWSHALDVIGHADEIADMAESAGNALDRDALLLGAAWHDADYHLPLEVGRSREERSALLARLCIRQYDTYLADRVASAIIDTTVDKRPKSSMLGVALHYADVGYLASSAYGRFFRRLDYMRIEKGVSDDEWRVFADKTRRFGRLVIDRAQEELSQIIGQDGVQVWVGRITDNLDKLDDWVSRQ